MPSTTELKCSFCDNLYTKKTKYVTARKKAGFSTFFCSLSCAASKVKTSTSCFVCGVEMVRQPSWKKSKSGNYYCSRSCATIENNKRFKSKENHPNWVNGRTSYRHGRDLEQCVECGETRYYLLLTHHRNRDRTANGKDNLEDVCYNCHALRHLVVKNGRLAVRWEQLTTQEAKEMLLNGPVV